MRAMIAMTAVSLLAFPLNAAPLTVPRLMERHGELAGKTVEVYGYLNGCYRLMCGLFDVEDAEVIGEGISIGKGARRVEAELAGISEAWVVLRARVTTACWSTDAVCPGRAAQVIPLQVRRASPPLNRGTN